MIDQSLTEKLSYWLVNCRTSGLPPATLETTKGYVLDWLGSALAGGITIPGKKLINYAQTQPTGPCQIIGTDLTGSAESAALVNGGLSHIVEMDDLDRGSVVHPGAVIIPAALAIVEREKSTGQAFLSAVAAGYEIAIRIGEAVGKGHYYFFHNTSTCGVFGAAAAAGWLLALSKNQFVFALGNAGTQAAGLWQFNADGDMSKHLHAGRAAANGVLAADLARQGFTGARRILEGKRGFFAATAPDANPQKVLENLGTGDLKIGRVSIKPHASCRHTHPAVDAALVLKTRITKPIQHIQIDTYQAALDLCDTPNPQTPYAAKFSLHYCVASALSRGHASLADFTPQAIMEPSIRELLSRVSTAVHPEFEFRYPVEWPTRVSVTLEDGTIHNELINFPKGDPENPLTSEELGNKFRQLASYSGQSEHSDAWLEWVDSLGPGPLPPLPKYSLAP